MLYNAVLFDLDGTLIDSRFDLAVAVNLMREHYGLSAIDVETVVSYIGDGMTKLVERAIVGENIELVDAVSVTKKCYSENLVVHTVFYDGVLDLLEQLSQAGVKMALTSNKPIEFCREIVKTMNVAHYFSAVYGGCDSYNLKPAPDMVQLAALDLEVTTDKCLMVGDNWTDIDAGQFAGSFTCYFRNGMGKALESVSDYEFDSFKELSHFASDKIVSLA